MRSSLAVRNSLLLVHRWSGLVIATIVLIASSTGALLAFYEPLDRWLAPDFYLEGDPASSLDAFELRDMARRRFPEAKFDVLTLTSQPGAWRLDAEVVVHGEPVSRQYAFDPSTGAFVAARDLDGWPTSPKNVLPFIHDLHARLALPSVIGIWILGLSAIAWTLNCFVGAYLTMPTRGRSFFRLWKPSWKVKWNAAALRLNFDLHRAIGLWFWGAMLVFAWSSVYQTLTYQVYEPVMRAFGFEFAVGDERQRGGAALGDAAEPLLSFKKAATLALAAARLDAERHDYAINGVHAIYLQRERGAFEVVIGTSRDIGVDPETFVHLSATDGAVLGITFLRGASGDSVSTWLGALHTASLGSGSAVYPTVVALIGVAIVITVVTGFVVWLKRRPAKSPRRAGLPAS